MCPCCCCIRDFLWVVSVAVASMLLSPKWSFPNTKNPMLTATLSVGLSILDCSCSLPLRFAVCKFMIETRWKSAVVVVKVHQ